MKKLFLPAALLFLLYAGVSNAQWFWLNPKPFGNSINAVMFADSLTGWVVGDCGSVAKTTNSGANWLAQTTGTVKFLYSINVINSQVVYAGGQSGVLLKTTNGGLNWSIIITDTTASLKAISFLNINTGWVFRGQGNILKTIDGGLSWVNQNIGSDVAINSLCFVNNSTGWAGGNNAKLYRTTNGGTNWDTVSYPTTNESINTVKFFSVNLGWFTSGHGVFRTSNGGINWSYFRPGPSTYNHKYLSNANENCIWISQYYYAPPYNNGYSILYSNDGGQSYSNKYIPALGTPMGLCLVTPTTGFVIMDAGRIYKSTNSGSSYTYYYPGMTEPAYAVHGFASDTCIMTSQSAVYKSVNGGTDWGIIRGSSNNLINSQFFNGKKGFLIYGSSSGSNYLASTTNGGNSWVDKLTGLPYLLNFYFINMNTGWLLSLPGRVFKTTDGGTSYNIYLTGNTGEHACIYFIDENTGWASGTSIRDIFRSTTGGTTWTSHFTNTYYNATYYSIYFLNKDTGWMAGTGGYIIKTTNSGLNWIFQGNGVTAGLHSIKFINPETGWTVGDAGSIYYSTNGGNNWTLQTPLTNRNLKSVSFINQYTGYAVGDFGTIIKTVNGGSVWVKHDYNVIPNTYTLSQNYPNPFNPTTKISFALPKSGLVTIKVFDVLGREIETLVNESLKPGTYEAAFDGTNYPSGVYFYRLTTDGFAETKRMMLIK